MIESRTAMPGLCRYSKALGEPGKGIHSARIGGLAAFDLLGTLALSWVATRCVFGRVGLVALAIVFIILMISAVLIHKAFCVNTRLNAWIFGQPWPDADARPKEPAAAPPS